jgi:hypothetical protein
VRDGRVVDRRIAEKFSSEQFADAAIEFLRSRSDPGPFFCYVAFTGPHDSRNPPESFREIYYRDRPPLPANFLHPFDNGILKDPSGNPLIMSGRPGEIFVRQLG